MARRSSSRPSVEDIVRGRRAEIVERVISLMQRDGLRWMEPWLPALTPHNPLSKVTYSGRNRLHLAYAAYAKGFEDRRWCTYNQAENAGWHVRKGERGFLVEKWGVPTHKETQRDEQTGRDEEVTVASGRPRLLRYHVVFNLEQLEGDIPQEEVPTHEADETRGIAENLILSSRCPVVQSTQFLGRAAFAPLEDRIVIAPMDTFRSDECFTRTLLHEMTHSTGHESALNRDIINRFGTPGYAKEELTAELGSLFMSADLGIQNASYDDAHFESHAAYLQSWLSALEDNPSYLFDAAAAADRAGAFVMERYGRQLERTREREVPELEQAEQGYDLASEAREMADASDALSATGHDVPDVDAR